MVPVADSMVLYMQASAKEDKYCIFLFNHEEREGRRAEDSKGIQVHYG